MIRFVGLVILITALFVSLRFTLSEMGKDSLVYDEETNEYRPTGLKNVVRKIASTTSNMISPNPTKDERSPVERNRDDEAFKDFKSESDPDENAGLGVQAADQGNEISRNEISKRRTKKQEEYIGIEDPIKKGTDSNPAVASVGVPGSAIPRSPSSTATPPPSSSSTGTVAPSKLECFSNIGGGAYSAPLTLSFSCSATATISYCIAEGTCCSPSTGSTYTAPFNLGANGTTYCVSFSGSDSFGNSSEITQQTYSFSNLTPDIQVVHQKIWYQTTQLEGKLSLGSSDYGEPSIEGGVLNFKGSDPVIAGYPSCAEQVEDSAPLTPLSIMPQTDLSHLTSSMQLDVYYSDLKLIYGDNYITSYLVSTAFDPTYSCNTTKIRLEDFDYFDTNPMIVKTTGSVHEFSGGFTPISFFEAPAASISRSPAGSSMKDNNGQELRSGLFGVFY